MKELQKLSEKTHKEILEGSLDSVISAVLYYVFIGRNAWHSTWVTQYSVGCMHLELGSAKRHAESRRVQGSVFNIRQIPALTLCGSNGLIFVTQINTTTPFSGYSPQAVPDDPPPGYKKMEESTDNYLIKGAPMLGAALSFNWNSRFWIKRPPANNSILLFAAPEVDPSAIEVLNANAELSQYVSFSHGGNYLLGWRSRAISMENSHILSIASAMV